MATQTTDMRKTSETGQPQAAVSLTHVFGERGGATAPLAYVERHGVDSAFRAALGAHTHVAVYGARGVGKTSLVQRYADPARLIYVECHKSQTAPDLYRSILAESGARVKTETKLTKKRRLAATLKVFSGDTERGTESTEADVTLDLGNVGDVFRTLATCVPEPLIVLNNFQELPRSAQRRIVDDLQYVLERTTARIMLIGTWSSTAYLTDLNQMLPSFLTAVDARAWSDDEFGSLLDRAERLLNITIAPALRDRLVQMSGGSARELIEICTQLLDDLGVTATQPTTLPVSAVDELESVLSGRTARPFSRYRRLLTDFLTADFVTVEGMDLEVFIAETMSGDLAHEDDPEGLTRFPLAELVEATRQVIAEAQEPTEQKLLRRKALIDHLHGTAHVPGRQTSVSLEDVQQMSLMTGLEIDRRRFRAAARRLMKQERAAGFRPRPVVFDPRSVALVAVEPSFRAFLRSLDSVDSLVERAYWPLPGSYDWIRAIRQRATVNRALGRPGSAVHTE